MRAIAIIVAILGLAVLVFGVLFIVQAGSGEQEIADSVAPLTLDQVNDKYDAVSAKYDALKASEEPNIQAQKAVASPSYNYLSAQRALLGLAKSNIGITQFIRVSGIIDIVLGLGLVLAGIALMKRE